MTAHPAASEVIAWAVDAFECAAAANPSADVFAFAPLRGYPNRIEVVVELVRVDMELARRRGKLRLLRHYLTRCPALAKDRKVLQTLAFEEYRQRRLNGEQVDSESYATAYGIDVTVWPPILPDRIPVVSYEKQMNC